VHKNLPDVLKAAHAHKGASFVEIYQNCVVYNDDVFASFTERSVAQEKQLWLKAGEKDALRGRRKRPGARRRAACLKDRRGDDPSVIVPRSEERGVAAMLIEMPQASRSRLASSTRHPAPTFEIRGDRAELPPPLRARRRTPGLVSKGQTWQVEKRAAQALIAAPIGQSHPLDGRLGAGPGRSEDRRRARARRAESSARTCRTSTSSSAMRRGTRWRSTAAFTHGHRRRWCWSCRPILAGLLWLLDRWQSSHDVQERSCRCSFGWLVAALLSGRRDHPLLDHADDLFGPAAFAFLETSGSHADGCSSSISGLWLLLANRHRLSKRREQHGKEWRRLPGRDRDHSCLQSQLNLVITDRANAAVRDWAADREPKVHLRLSSAGRFWRRDLVWRGGRLLP
jgi:hypothetical protein